MTIERMRIKCWLTKARYHTLTIFNTYCFSTATMITRTLPIVTFCVHFLSLCNDNYRGKTIHSGGGICLTCENHMKLTNTSCEQYSNILNLSTCITHSSQCVLNGLSYTRDSNDEITKDYLTAHHHTCIPTFPSKF
jgi:hypothetical protein